MKNQKAFNDFETLCTYNFVGNKKNEPVNEKQNNEYKKGDKVENSAVLSEIMVLSPLCIEDVNKIILTVKKSQPVIVDLTYRKESLTQKVLNYLNGAIFALNGSINKLVENMYLILPQGVSLSL